MLISTIAVLGEFKCKRHSGPSEVSGLGISRQLTVCIPRKRGTIRYYQVLSGIIMLRVAVESVFTASEPARTIATVLPLQACRC